MTAKPISGWAIKHWNGSFYIDTVRRTRREAIDAFIERFTDEKYTWAEASDVHRAVRVTIAESVASKETGR